VADELIRLEDYAVNARTVFADAQKMADAARHPYVTSRHLAVAMLVRGWGVDALVRSGHDPAQVLRGNRSWLEAMPASSAEPSCLAAEVLEAMKSAQAIAAKLDRQKVDLECVARALSAIPKLEDAEWPLHERLGVPKRAEAPRAPFDVAVRRAAKVLAEVAPRVVPHVGPEPRPSMNVLRTLDAILEALAPPDLPPGLAFERPERGVLVIARTDAPSAKIRCGWEPPEIVTVTIESGERSATQRYAWSDEAQLWRSDDGELFADLRDILLSLYPEADSSG